MVLKKKTGLLIGTVLTVLIMVVSVLNVNLTSDLDNDTLIFQNVEALAQGEGTTGWGICAGEGSLQCPEFDVKVYAIYSR